MKRFVVILSMLLFAQNVQADQSVWFTTPAKQALLLVSWKIESVERVEDSIIVRTVANKFTIVPDPQIAELKGLDSVAVFHSALGKLIGSSSGVSDATYQNAQKVIQDNSATNDLRQESQAVIQAYQRWFPCASITVQEMPLSPPFSPGSK